MNRTWGTFVVGAGVFCTSGAVLAEYGWKGYLEDRRPASNADPYRVTSRILKTYAEAHQKAIA